MTEATPTKITSPMSIELTDETDEKQEAPPKEIVVKYLKGKAAKNVINPNTQVVITDDKETPRNAPCPCKSGKKYKKCCLRLEYGM